MSKNILVLPGDGIGPEIVTEAVKVIARLREGVGLTGPSATNRTLVLENVQEAQAGNYRVNVYNTAGAVLLYLGLPRMDETPG